MTTYKPYTTRAMYHQRFTEVVICINNFFEDPYDFDQEAFEVEDVNVGVTTRKSYQISSHSKARSRFVSAKHIISNQNLEKSNTHWMSKWWSEKPSREALDSVPLFF